jgi:hypothetical protein
MSWPSDCALPVLFSLPWNFPLSMTVQKLLNVFMLVQRRENFVTFWGNLTHKFFLAFAFPRRRLLGEICADEPSTVEIDPAVRPVARDNKGKQAFLM